MIPLKRLAAGAPDFEQRLEALLAFESAQDPQIDTAVAAILADVKQRGDAALIEYTNRFDRVALTSAAALEIPRAELARALANLPVAQRTALETAAARVRDYHQRQLAQSWSYVDADGTRLGQQVTALERVGIYVPGGKAAYPSSVLMNALPAKVAGVDEIIMVVPTPGGERNPLVLAAAALAGVDRVFAVGGAQAVAALAYGTKTIRRVQKIFGPGNAYVSMAKRLLVGRVAIDLLAGPSDLLVLADDTANPKFAAADMLAQAEHGSGHERVWLVTTSAKILNAVEKEISKQLPKLPRREFIQRVLDRNTWLIQVASVADAVALANQVAPEHCEVITRDARRVSGGIVTAGAIFLGNWSPTVLGDYVAGPSHVLPTDGAGASFAGLTVDQFQRRTSVVEYNRASLKKALKSVKKFAELEGLGAHGKSAEARMK